MNLQYYATFLGITLIFIILVLRACYYMFVIKKDPVKAILPPIPAAFKKILTAERREVDKKTMESYS